MANVTPNTGGRGSQSLQAAAAGVSQGGDAASNAINTLTAMLAQMNQQIVSTFQQQAQQQQAQAFQQEQEFRQRTVQGMEDVANQIVSNQQRKRTRRENMEDFKAETDYSIGAQGKERDRTRSIELALAAEERRQAAEIQKQTQDILQAMPRARQQVQSLQSSLDAIQESIPLIEDPQARAGANNLLLSIRGRLGQVQSVPEELIALAERAAAAKSMEHADSLMRKHQQMVNPGPTIDPEGPQTVPETFQPPALDTPLALDEPTIRALKGWADMQIPGNDYNFLDPDNPTLAIGDVETMAHALRFNAMDAKIRDQDGRKHMMQKLTRVAAESKTTYEEFKKATMAFQQQLAPISGSTAQEVLRSLAVQQGAQVPVTSPNGTEQGRVPSGKAIYQEFRRKLAEPFGQDTVAALEQYYAGQPIVDAQAMMPIASLATAIDSVIHTTLGEAVKDPNVLDIRDLATDTNSFNWSDADLYRGVTRELDRAISFSSPSASQSRFLKQPAPAQLNKSLRLNNVFLKSTATDSVLPDLSVDPQAVASADGNQMSEDAIDMDIFRSMREAAEAIDESDTYLKMAQFVTEGVEDPSLKRLTSVFQPPPTQPQPTMQGPGAFVPPSNGVGPPMGPMQQPPQQDTMIRQQQGPPKPPTGPMDLNDTMNDAFGSNVNTFGTPKVGRPQDTLIGRSVYPN